MKKRQVPMFGIQKEIGVGDLVKKATKSVGIKPCRPCEKRAARLNSIISFVPRRNS